jgi:hypothetical protein
MLEQGDIESMIYLVIGKDGAENITKFPFGPEHNIIRIITFMSDTKTIVNSWNEWDQLKHVIVGKSRWHLYTST